MNSLFHYVVVDIIGIILLLDILMLLRIPSLKACHIYSFLDCL